MQKIITRIISKNLGVYSRNLDTSTHVKIGHTVLHTKKPFWQKKKQKKIVVVVVVVVSCINRSNVSNVSSSIRSDIKGLQLWLRYAPWQSISLSLSLSLSIHPSIHQTKCRTSIINIYPSQIRGFICSLNDFFTLLLSGCSSNSLFRRRRRRRR